MIECDDLRAWTIASETDRLRSGAAADLEHATTGRKPGISMEEAHDRGSLRQQALALVVPCRAIRRTQLATSASSNARESTGCACGVRLFQRSRRANRRCRIWKSIASLITGLVISARPRSDAVRVLITSTST